MKRDNTLILTDFNNDLILNFIKSKKKSFKLKSKYYDNLLINFDQILSLKENYEFLFFISQINKFFNFDEILTLKENLKIKKINDITDLIALNIKRLSSKHKKIIFFLWPQDTNDDYLGFINFKKTGKNWLINYINLEIASKLSAEENIYIIDLNFKLLQCHHKFEIYDNKTKYLIDNHYSIGFMEFLAEEISSTINFFKFKKIKLLILDLDNTLWGGEAGERNYNSLELGPNSIKGLVYQDFQKRLKILKKIGFVLAICSKNDIKNVKKVFEKNKNMILSFNDFSAFRVNWQNKNENVREILKELNLRSENALFIDDTNYERDIVKSDIKEIQIFEFPDNILLLNEKFNQLKQLQKNTISKTDINRTKLYLDEKKRKSSRDKFFNKSDWLSSLKIEIKIRKLKNLKRAEEMFLRTNQFNTSHQVLSSQKIEELIIKKKRIFYEVEMIDKFGDYGIISIIGIKIERKKFIVTDFLQSCRVFQRNIEMHILQFILKNKDFKDRDGFILINRNKKNIYVQDLFDNSSYLEKINSKSYRLKKNCNFKEIKNIKTKIN